MQTLEVQKRDKIPAETLMAWFTTFRDNGWTNEQLQLQVSKMLKTVTYGTIKIDDFFNVENKITPQESESMSIKFYQNKVAEAERLLCGQEFEVDLPNITLSKEQIKLAIAKRLQVYYLAEIDEKAIEVINEAIKYTAEKLGFKKVEYQNDTLTHGQRLRKRLSM